MTVLPTVRSQMVEAARRQASRRQRFPALRRRWPVVFSISRDGIRGGLRDHAGHVSRAPKRREAGWGLVVIVSTVLTVAIVLVAFALLHRGGYVRPAAPQKVGLRARLAVLRRPQQPSDRLPARALRQQGLNRAVIHGLSRLVATLPHAKLYLVVTRPYYWRAWWSPKLGDDVVIIEVTHSSVSESLGIPAADLNDPSHVAVLGNSIGRQYAVQIVPDGVTKVRWAFSDNNGGADHVVTVNARNNVAFTHADSRTNPGFLHRVTWYRPDGTVAPTSFAALRETMAAQEAPHRAQAIRYDMQHSRPVPAGLLANFSIFKIDSPTGVRVAPGITILHPRVLSLPTQVLLASDPAPYDNLDPVQMREVITPAGAILVVPGQRGICIVLDRTSPLTGLPEGGGSSCNDQGLAKTVSQGVGLTSWRAGTSTTLGLAPNTQHTVTIHTGPNKNRTIRPIYGIYILQTRAPAPHEPPVGR